MSKTKKRRYDAASQSNRLTGWITQGTDATSAIERSDVIRNRVRDLVRNNPWAAKGVNTIVTNTIGYGIRAQWKTKNKQSTKKIQDLWNKWSESNECDSTGLTNFYGLQQLAMRSLIESGECLIILRPRLASDDLTVPMQLQILEPDYLVSHLDGKAKNGNHIDRGIEYDQFGKRVAYYLYKYHPGSNSKSYIGQSLTYSRIDASEVIHLFRRDRPGQERGVSWLSSVVITLRELDIYEDAYLKRQQIANMHAGFIITDEPIDEEIEAYAETADPIQPGAMHLMRPNRTVEFNTPPQAGDYGQYTMDNLRRVAAALGITFESLTGNLSDVNFSSARIGWQEMGRNVETWRWNLFIPLFCNTVAVWFAKFCYTQDAIAEWTPPARTLVDPTKELPAIKSAIRAGLLTPSEAMREQGYDPEQLMKEWSEDAKKMDELGLIFDCDPRQDKPKEVSNDK